MLTQFDVLRQSNVNTRLNEKAQRLFNAALLRGNLLVAINGLLGRRSSLKMLPGFASFRCAYSRGLKIVPIRRVIGSENRSLDYDRYFHPLNERTRTRWMNIALSLLRERVLPPVDLIEVDGFYYIRDGHHRVSVATALGQMEIEAFITVWER